MTVHPFFPHQPIISSDLPLTLMSLEDWVVITVTGRDSEKYLQSQVTVDVKKIAAQQYMLGAHCNPRGKLWSSFYLFYRQNGFALIVRRSTSDTQLTALKKYAIFSNVTIITNNQLILLGVAGSHARIELKKLFSKLPDASSPLVNDGITSLLWFKYPVERFLLVTDIITTERIVAALHQKAEMNDSQQWLALNIEAGEPVIDLVNSEQFVPQAINLHALGGISFKKGCYIGQEIVARTKFRGTNKLALWYLIGHANHVPQIGEKLELKIGESWRRTGTILAAVKIKDGRLLVQAVINSTLDLNSVLRVSEDTNVLSIQLLPYSLNV